MKLIPNIDLFLHKQPNKEFEKILNKPLHCDKPINFKDRKAHSGEINISRLNLIFNFPDKNGELEFCYKDFLNFLKSIDVIIDKNGVLLSFKQNLTLDDEEFIIDATKNEILISAYSTRGVRLALIFIEDEIMRANAPILPIKKYRRKPFIKSRISRCFFTPPSHASSEGTVNELMADIDYYPEEYLNRLVHQGINGLWIGTSFKNILKSNIIKEYGTEEDIQVKKLNQIIEKCKKFGIDIFVFCVEPTCTPEIISNYSDLTQYVNEYCSLLCPSKQPVKDYIKESVTRLFTLVPNLGGIINITVGEESTTCASLDELLCPECKKTYKTLGNTLSTIENLFCDTMKQVAPNAKFISWTYAQRNWNFVDADESCYLRDKSVIHMQNFEDLGRPVQLGKKRLAADYWLSYRGPGKLIKRTTKISKKRGITLFAKLQVCSSHEISTIPYVPVPGILYDKYKYLYKNGFAGVLQCWYFGNYPSLMNKAATYLSYLPFYKTKKSFLNHLAKIYCNIYYKNLVKAWREFEKGYENFPVNVAFEWFGPMQDSPCAPLSLKPKDWPLSGTWLKTEQAGDRIGECLLNGHTIDEAIILIERLCNHWKKGMVFFEKIKHGFDSSFEEQISLVKSACLIFESGYNVLRFYKLRHILGIRLNGDLKILNQMKEIVKKEIEISSTLIPLCTQDIRIGYHSEANGYKIFPEKLKWRIKELENLLLTEFPDVENNIIKNKIPLPFYFGMEKNYLTIRINYDDWTNFKFEDGSINNNVSLKATEKNGVISILIKTSDENASFEIKPEFNVLFPKTPLFIENQKLVIKPSNDYSICKDMLNKELSKFNFKKQIENNIQLYTLSFNRKSLDMSKNEPFRLAITCKNGNEISYLNNSNEYFASQLIRDTFFPYRYCFFVSK